MREGDKDREEVERGMEMGGGEMEDDEFLRKTEIEWDKEDRREGVGGIAC